MVGRREQHGSEGPAHESPRHESPRHESPRPHVLLLLPLLMLPLAACGGGAATGAGEATRAAEAEAPAMLDEAAGVAEAVRPTITGIVDPTRIEPLTLVPLEVAPHPEGPVRVRVAWLDLNPRASFRPPAGSCQDVLLLVRGGELRAVGSGIAPPEAPSTLYAGDAIRFGPEGDGLVQNLSEHRARTVVAFVRPPDRGEPSSTNAGGADCGVPAAGDPLIAGLRSASVRTTPARESLGGKLRVRALLDEAGQGARYGGLSVLEADADVVTPRHRHAGAAEILVVETGSGVFRIGERDYPVRPGVALYVPEGVLHSYSGDGEQPLRAIQVHTPAQPDPR